MLSVCSGRMLKECPDEDLQREEEPRQHRYRLCESEERDMVSVS